MDDIPSTSMDKDVDGRTDDEQSHPLDEKLKNLTLKLLKEHGVMLSGTGNAASPTSSIDRDEWTQRINEPPFHACDSYTVDRAIYDILSLYNETAKYEMRSDIGRCEFMYLREELMDRHRSMTKDPYIGHGDFIAAMCLAGFPSRFRREEVFCEFRARV